MAIAEGIKYWSDNEAVRGFDANAFLMSQSVMRFESASDRDVALVQSLTEGMVAYDKSTNSLQLYDGSTWQNVAVGTVGVTDHGLLTGLGDDDHPQYLTEARGDTRYYTESESDSRFVNATGDSMTGSLTTTGVLQAQGPDGGMVLRNWQASAAFGMVGTANMTSSEYALLTNGIDTYIGAGSGGTTHFRGPDNDQSPQLRNNGSEIIHEGGTFRINTDSSIRQSSSTWTGNPGSGQGKLEYHDNRWYIVAGSNSTEVARFRRDASDVGNIANDGRLNFPFWSTTGRNYSNEWIQFDNHSGLYSPLNAAHFYPSNGTFGAWRIDGGRSGYNGIHFSHAGGYMALMVRLSDGLGGFYNNGRWYMYGEYGGSTRLFYAGGEKFRTVAEGVWCDGRQINQTANVSSTYTSAHYEARSSVTSGGVASFTAHVIGAVAPVFRVWTGTGEGFDCNNSTGTLYAYVGGSQFITRSSQRWKKHIHQRSDDAVVPRALDLLGCRTVIWDDATLDSEWCEEDQCYVNKEICDDPNCDCKCCSTARVDPINRRHFNRRGYLAEELAEVLPEAVHFEQDGTPSGIDYSMVTVELMDITKLLVLQCEDQERRLKELEGVKRGR